MSWNMKSERRLSKNEILGGLFPPEADRDKIYTNIVDPTLAFSNYSSIINK
jgi:hypothetical protein